LSLKNLREAYHHTGDASDAEMHTYEESKEVEPMQIDATALKRQSSKISASGSSSLPSERTQGGFVSEEDPHIQWDKTVMQDL